MNAKKDIKEQLEILSETDRLICAAIEHGYDSITFDQALEIIRIQKISELNNTLYEYL